jgi:acetyl-CoA carboxylase carboxyl transferase subunit alpha
MKQAEKFQRPVVTLINTAGAFCGIGAEERGEGEAIARNLMEMSDLTVPILAIIIGEGGSGGALALALGDEVWMMEHSIYAILSPEGFASILWKDGSRAKEAAGLMKITAQELFELGVIEKVIAETHEEAFLPKEQLMEQMKAAISTKLAELSTLQTEELLEARYQRFRRF